MALCCTQQKRCFELLRTLVDQQATRSRTGGGTGKLVMSRRCRSRSSGGSACRGPPCLSGLFSRGFFQVGAFLINANLRLLVRHLHGTTSTGGRSRRLPGPGSAGYGLIRSPPCGGFCFATPRGGAQPKCGDFRRSTWSASLPVWSARSSGSPGAGRPRHNRGLAAEPVPEGSWLVLGLLPGQRPWPPAGFARPPRLQGGA